MKIILEINDQKLEVTMDEAKKLFNELKEIFDKEQKTDYPIYPSYPSTMIYY